MPTPRTRPELLSGRWLAAHLLAAAVAAVLVSLGVWQLQRLGEVRATQARVDAHLTDEPAPVGRLAVPAGPTAAGVDELEFRRVRATGTYAPGEQVLQRSRAHEDRPGFHVLTPLRLDAGGAVLVRRGWIPRRLGERGDVAAEAGPPPGRVTVTGFLQRSERQPGFGPTDPDQGTLEEVFHADIARLDRQTDAELYPMVLQLQSQQPPQPGRLPIPAPDPELDTTQNLSYAIQWFSFAVIGLTSYGAFLWRRTREGGQGPDRDGDTASRETDLTSTRPDRR